MTDILNAVLAYEKREEEREIEERRDRVRESRENLPLQDIYEYYKKRGFYPLFIESVARVGGVAVTLISSLFTFFLVDYSKLLQVQQTESLTNFIHFSRAESFLFLFFTISSVIIFGIYIYKEIIYLKKFHKVYSIYANKLQCRDTELDVIRWSGISEKISREYIITPQDIREEICRTENYLTEIYSGHNSILNITTQTYDYIVRQIIEHVIFREGLQDKASYERDIKIVSYTLGVISIIFYPVIAFFATAYFVFRYTLQISSQTRPSFNLIDKEWTWVSRYIFRYTNELPHEYEERISQTYNSAKLYTEQFYQERDIVIYRFLIFLLGTLLSPLLLISIYRDEVLWNVTLFNHSLVWYVTTLSIFIFLLYSLIPQKYTKSDPRKYANEVTDILKISPREWSTNPERWSVYYSFKKYFHFKFYIALKEFFALLMIPYFLLRYLPNHSGELAALFGNCSITKRCDHTKFYFKYSVWSEISNLTEDRYIISHREILNTT